MRVNPAISQILLGKHDFCRLCFNLDLEDAFKLQDEIILAVDSSHTSQQIMFLLSNVLGYEITSNMSQSDSICKKCLVAAKTSYNFVNVCQENNKNLINTIDSLNDCLDNTTDNLNSYKSVFVNINLNDFSSEQYYDNESTNKNFKEVLSKFKCLTTNKNKNLCTEGIKSRKSRIYQYSDEFSKICEIIRVQNRSQYKCKECNALFTKSFNFKKHYSSRHSCKTVSCNECGRKYGSESLLKQHKHDSHVSIICSECGKVYQNRYSLLYHMRQHSGEQPYKCPHCDMKFQWSSRRAEHIRRYHLEPSVECDICHVKVKTLGSLYDHRKRHFNPFSRLYVTHQTPPVAEETEIEVSTEQMVLFTETTAN